MSMIQLEFALKTSQYIRKIRSMILKGKTMEQIIQGGKEENKNLRHFSGEELEPYQRKP